ncbi:MAG: mechanosensitive ion channel family protein [Candidatus Acidiferrales bacterium]
MKTAQKIIFFALVLTLFASVAAVIYTRNWADYHDRARALWLASNQSSTLVDTHALDTAQQLQPLAVTRLEKQYAAEALRLGDHSVDLAFAAALQDAAANPAPLTPRTRKIVARIKQAESAVAAGQDRIDALKKQLTTARATQHDAIQQQLDLVQAQFELDQDDLEDAHQDLILAGGDKHASIQKLLDQHEASEVHKDNGQASGATNAQSAAAEAPDSSSVIADFRAWLSVRSKQRQLAQAQKEALERGALLMSERTELNKQLAEEKAQKKIIHDFVPQGSPAAAPSPAKPAVAATAVSPGSAAATPGARDAGASPESVDQAAQPPSELDVVKNLAADQRALSSYGKRIDDEQQLATNYATWILLDTARKQSFLHGILKSACWVLLIALCVFIANEWLQRFFASLALDRRQLHTIRALILFTVQLAGLLLILLVIFGVPQNVATVAALAGAGLTVACKDFIVGFFGWFVLMGKDGIRPGDWVEINGVGGEVLEVGIFRTVLLETGNWADAGHPTGRKVTFVNSFAIEGHYFNFSTSGQWLWDEIQVQVPQNADPYSVAESIKKIATDETSANARLAEEEWERVAPNYGKQSFSANPSLSVKPSGSGVTVSVRYITRVNERYEVRSRVYREVVELLRNKDLPETAAAGPAKKE